MRYPLPEYALLNIAQEIDNFSEAIVFSFAYVADK
jgi:hypothetical protein